MSFRSLLAVVALLAIPASAGATPLNLSLEAEPDIMSAGISVSYEAGTDSFSAVGTAIILTSNGSHFITGGVFDLQATIDSTGAAIAGLLTITGQVEDQFGTIHTGELLRGSLIAFGFSDVGSPDPFEFLFETTGGALAGGTYDDYFGVIVSMTYSISAGTQPFANSFDGLAYMGLSDTSPIPEPSASVLAAVGGLVVALKLRRRGTARA